MLIEISLPVFVCFSVLRNFDDILRIHYYPARAGKVIGCGVYIYIYVCERKKYLNRILEIDSPFQTFAVGLLVEFID